MYYIASSASIRFLFSPAVLSVPCWQLNTFLPKIRKGTPVKNEFLLLKYLMLLHPVFCASVRGGVSIKLTRMIPQLWYHPSHARGLELDKLVRMHNSDSKAL